MWVGTCLLTILFLAIAIYQKAKVLYQKMPEDHDHLPCVSNQSEHDNCFRASQVDKDYIRMFIKEEKRKRALFQLSLTPHSTDISLISSGPGFFLLFSFFFSFILIRIIKRILKVSVHATLSQAPGYCIANFQASPESCKSFNKCL